MNSWLILTVSADAPTTEWAIAHTVVLPEEYRLKAVEFSNTVTIN